MTSIINWRSFAGTDQFGGASSAEELRDLAKALAAGNDRDPVTAAPGVGFPLRVESLDRTLKNTTFRAEHVKLWRMIGKSPAFNTVEEYNQVQSYGQSDMGAFIDEGGLPEETDAQYERKFATVKFMGTTRRVNHVMTLVRPAHGNIIAQETIAGTMRLLESIERGLFFARSDLDSVQWDGFEKLIEDGAPSTNIVDLRGAPLTEDNIVDATLTISDSPNYGIATHIITNPKVKSDMVKGFFPKARYDQFQKTSDGMVGLDIRGVTTGAGDIEIVPDVFIDDGGSVPSAAVGDASKRPATPTITTALTSPANASSQFTADDEGSYYLYVVAVNKYGQSAPVAVNAVAAAVVAGDKFTFGVTPGAGPSVSYFKVYRSTKDGATSTCRQILRVANAAGMGESTINDYNANIPGTYKAFMFQLNSQNMEFKQLAPMIKIPLGTVDASIRWMQLLYGMPVLFTPRHNVIFKNIGRSADAVAV